MLLLLLSQDAWALLGGVHSLRGEELLTEIVRLEKRVWDELDAVVSSHCRVTSKCAEGRDRVERWLAREVT